MAFWRNDRTDDKLFRENVARLADALMESVAKRELIERYGTNDHLRVVNVVQFAILWNADLSSLLDDIRRLNGIKGEGAGWKRKLTARLLALTMLECADEFSSLLGKPFRDTVQELCGDPIVLSNLGNVHKELNEFRKRNDKPLRTVRNTVIAHRDPDASKQIEALRTLSVKNIEQLGIQLLDWTNKLLSLLSMVMAHRNGEAISDDL